MTHREYKQKQVHWSVMDAGVRLVLPIQRRLTTLELMRKERQNYGATGIYHTLQVCLSLASHITREEAGES